MTSYTRRIQLTGGSTYTVSLPSRWIRENKLDKGSELNIEETDGDLLLSRVGVAKVETVKTIDVEGKVDLDDFQRALTSIYISDFDTLVIRSSRYIDQHLRETVKKFSRLVMGVEIFEESSKTIVLQNVLDSKSFPLSNAIRRMSLNVETMIGDAIKGIEENDIGLLDSVIERDDEVDRYQLYIYRAVKGGKSTEENNIFMLIFSRILERTADHAVKICKDWKTSEPLVPETKSLLVDFLKKSNSLYKVATEAFYSRRFDELNRIISRKPEFINLKHGIIVSIGSTGGSSSAVSISEEVLRIALYSTDIAELAMDIILGERNEFTLRA